MGTPPIGAFLGRLRQAMAAEALADVSDRELVERFRAGRDEAAFRAVVDRHGPMVFQVCRRVLSSRADVEDAFQATFLVLVRRGHTIRRRGSLASWLHGVARRTALKLRTEAARRKRREERVARPPVGGVADDTPWGELRAVLDDELGRLPDGCRAALVLCYLEGRTQDEAAAQLGVSKSTVRRNLDRGRDLLGRRLARRGVTLGAVLSARLLTDCAEGAALPPNLLARTAASASHTAAGSAAPASVLSARVAALTDGVTKAMQLAKYKTVVTLLACGLALGVGVGHFGPRAATAQDPPPATARTPAAPDIDPIDPDLLFDEAIQKHLKLSPNQVRQLTEAKARGTAKTTDQARRVAEIGERVKKLQDEIERLHAERDKVQQVVHKAETEQVRAAIPAVLSRDAVQELRQLTIQRMRLSDVLLNARVKARLNLNDEQVKKIQEITDKKANVKWTFVDTAQPRTALLSRVNLNFMDYAVILSDGLTDDSKAELLKVLTPQQREALERLSGMTFEKK